MTRLFSIIICIGTILLVSKFNDDILHMTITNSSISWNLSYWLPKIVILVFTIFAVNLISPYFKFKTLLKFISIFILFFALLGISFAISPIYEGDLSKSGVTISSKSYTNNKTIDFIKKKYPNFEGSIIIASSTCNYCEMLAEKFSILKTRKPKKDVLVVIFSSNQSVIEEFKYNSSAYNLDYILAPDEQGTLELCEGQFPTIFYMKNKAIVHKWSNDEFGYPAFSWVENDLN